MYKRQPLCVAKASPLVPIGTEILRIWRTLAGPVCSRGNHKSKNGFFPHISGSPRQMFLKFWCTLEGTFLDPCSKKGKNLSTRFCTRRPQKFDKIWGPHISGLGADIRALSSPGGRGRHPHKIREEAKFLWGHSKGVKI